MSLNSLALRMTNLFLCRLNMTRDEVSSLPEPHFFYNDDDFDMSQDEDFAAIKRPSCSLTWSATGWNRSAEVTDLPVMTSKT